MFGPEGETVLDTSGGSLGANIMVSDDTLPVGLLGVAKRDVARAEQMLRQGGMVAFVSPGRSVDGDTATVVQHLYDQETGEDTGTREAKLPAAFVTLTDPWAGPAAVVSTAAAEELGAEPATVALAVTGNVSEQQEEAANEGLAAISDSASLYVERGYQADDATVDRADRPARPGRRPDARRHPDRHLPGPLRRATRPRHALRCRRLAAHPARGRCGVRRGGRPGRGAAGRRGRVHPRHRGDLAAHLQTAAAWSDELRVRRRARSSTSRG